MKMSCRGAPAIPLAVVYQEGGPVRARPPGDGPRRAPAIHRPKEFHRPGDVEALRSVPLHMRYRDEIRRSWPSATAASPRRPRPPEPGAPAAAAAGAGDQPSGPVVGIASTGTAPVTARWSLIHRAAAIRVLKTRADSGKSESRLFWSAAGTLK